MSQLGWLWPHLQLWQPLSHLVRTLSLHTAATVWAGARQDPIPDTTCSLSTAPLRALSPGIAQHQALCLVIPMLGSQSGPSRFNTKSFRDSCSLFRHLLSCSHTSYEGSCSYPHQNSKWYPHVQERHGQASL